jgi:hypothetical protein
MQQPGVDWRLKHVYSNILYTFPATTARVTHWWSGPRQRRFDGNNFKPRTLPACTLPHIVPTPAHTAGAVCPSGGTGENAQTPTTTPTLPSRTGVLAARTVACGASVAPAHFAGDRVHYPDALPGRCVSWLSTRISTFHGHHANISETNLRILLLLCLRGLAAMQK